MGRVKKEEITPTEEFVYLLRNIYKECVNNKVKKYTFTFQGRNFRMSIKNEYIQVTSLNPHNQYSEDATQKFDIADLLHFN